MIAGFIYSRQKKVKALDIDSVKEEPVGIQVSNNNVKLNEEEARKVMEALKEYMEKSRPYLNVDLKQSEVAAAIGCSAYILSTVFTHYLKVGYYDFINGYRVEEFKQAIKEGKHQKYTLVTLAEKCGFKSKTSFFRTFKKFTGFTPNEYIQHQDEN
jgi:AraC-like DNA-binding protein